MKTKLQLAREYFPDATSDKNALRGLRRMIRRNAELTAALDCSHTFRKCHILTVYEEKMIYRFLGKP